MIYFVLKGFPYKDQNWRAICDGFILCIPSIFNFFINITLLTAAYLSKAQYGLHVSESVLIVRQWACAEYSVTLNIPVLQSRSLSNFICTSHQFLFVCAYFQCNVE